MIRIAQHIQVMLDDHDARSIVHERAEDVKQRADIQRMQADRRFVKDKQCIRLSAAHLAGQLQPLCLTAG